MERVGNLVVFTLRANAFLHHMVRNVVGSLVYVGAGRQPPAWIARAAAMAATGASPRPPSRPTACTSSAIEYDRSFGLPAFRPNPLLPSP